MGVCNIVQSTTAPVHNREGEASNLKDYCVSTEYNSL